MKELTNVVKSELKEIVFDFFADECEVERDTLTDNTNIMKDMDGDSLMFIELLGFIKKKYNLDIELQAIGKYLLKKPAETMGAVVDTACKLYEYENKIVELI